MTKVFSAITAAGVAPAATDQIVGVTTGTTDNLFSLTQINSAVAAIGIPAANITGKLGLSSGGTNADLSGTGAAHSFLKQSSAGAALTVGTIGGSDLPSGALLTYTGTSDPTTTNDSTQGFAAGSLGVNTGTGRAFVCRNASAAAAVWDPLGQSDHPGYVSVTNTQWYPTCRGAIINGASAGNGTTRLSPFILKERVTISSLGINISVLNIGGSLQLALYLDAVDTSATHCPANLIDKTASISTTNAGFVSAALGGNQQLEPGMYWVAWNSDNAPTRVTSPANTTGEQAYMIGSQTGANVAAAGLTVGKSVAQVFNTWGNLGGSAFADITTSGGCAGCLLIASAP